MASRVQQPCDPQGHRGVLRDSRGRCRVARARGGGAGRWPAPARRARLVADGGGLENRYGVTPIVGSNPTPSALSSGFALPEEVRRGASGAADRSRARYVPVRFGVVPAARRPRRAPPPAPRPPPAGWWEI